MIMNGMTYMRFIREIGNLKDLWVKAIKTVEAAEKQDAKKAA